MVLNEQSRSELIAAIQDGLPLVHRPYAEVGKRLGWSEQEVMAGIDTLKEEGSIKRFGVVVRHHELGYTANAMVVWDVPDGFVAELGGILSTYDCITLCYQRPRRLPEWPYNLFSMIHGKDRDGVLVRIDEIVSDLGLENIPREALFSTRRFKQRGARYR